MLFILHNTVFLRRQVGPRVENHNFALKFTSFKILALHMGFSRTNTSI